MKDEENSQTGDDERSRLAASTGSAAGDDLPAGRKLIVVAMGEPLEHRFEITRANGKKELLIVRIGAAYSEENYVIATLGKGDTVRPIHWPLPPNGGSEPFSPARKD